ADAKGGAANLRPFKTSQEAAEAGRRSGQKRRAIAAIAATTPRRLTANEWEALYLAAAFPDERGRPVFRPPEKDLVSLYAPPGSTSPQYKVLVRRLAVLATLSEQLDTRQAPLEERLAVEDRIVRAVGQLQKYTESMRFQNDLTVKVESSLLDRVAAAV